MGVASMMVTCGEDGEEKLSCMALSPSLSFPSPFAFLSSLPLCLSSNLSSSHSRLGECVVEMCDGVNFRVDEKGRWLVCTSEGMVVMAGSGDDS